MTAELSAILLVSATVLAAFSGVPLLLRLVSPTVGQRCATSLMIFAALCGITGATGSLIYRTTLVWSIAGLFPFSPTMLGIDSLTAFFSLPILLVAACCSIYALHYWPAEANPRTVRKLTLFFGLLVATMLLVILARSTGLFLLGWEVMALAAYFILTADDHKPAVRDAGTVYMICTHTGTLILFAFFSLLNSATGSFVFPAAASLSAVTPIATVIFITALFGFGFKAGIMPLHIWLPAAHANAPSHVSAIMSGVILKIGIYGIVRALSFFYDVPLWWGIVLLVLGMISGIVGVLFALGQHDIKRLLAYHSIENIGIIIMGVGVATIGVSSGSPLLVLLGLSGALLHVFNHATFKALLFLAAGAIIHATGTRDLEKMGGILRGMPMTALAFLTGAVAICGLPPLNGFISEILIYLGFFNCILSNDDSATIMTALAAPALALIGGLAVACFVKVFGVVFLGSPRSHEAQHAHEVGLLMRIPMGILGLVCFIIGLAPMAVAPLLQSAVTAWLPVNAPLPTLMKNAPLTLISIVSCALLVAIALIFVWYIRLLKKTTLTSGSTWGCGYLAPTSRMQYTGSSFADMLVCFFAGILRLESHQPEIDGSFSKQTRFSSHLPETVLERIYIPFLKWAHTKLLPVRHLQHGHLHIYILYTVVTLFCLIAISI